MTRAPFRSTWTGLLVAALSVIAITAVIFVLRKSVPVLSTGVLYLLAVLLVASYWGVWLGLLTAVASTLAFNWFHIPPTGRFTIAESENFVALAVFFIAAIVVSAFAHAVRIREEEAELREREADLALELGLILLDGEPDSLERAAGRIGEALGLTGVRLDERWVDSGASEQALPLLADGRRVGTLLLPRAADPEVGARLAPLSGC